MTPLSEKKDVQVIKYDMCVIVDNSVEIGDFFIFFVAFLTKSSEKLWISWSISSIKEKRY